MSPKSSTSLGQIAQQTYNPYLGNPPESSQPPRKKIAPLPLLHDLEFAIEQVLDFVDCVSGKEHWIHILGKARTLKVNARWKGFSGKAVMKIVNLAYSYGMQC